MSKFSRFFNLKLIVLISVILGTAFFIISKPKAADKFKTYEYIEYNVTHAFPVEATNLLEEKNADDGEYNSRLNKYDVRAALDSVFLSEGLQMLADTFLTMGDLSYPISAYDPMAKIGYIWLDYDRFGEGIMDDQSEKRKGQKFFEQEFLKSIDDGIELFLDDEETFLNDVFGVEYSEDQVTKEEMAEEWAFIVDSLSKSEVKNNDVRELLFSSDVFGVAKKKDQNVNVVKPFDWKLARDIFSKRKMKYGNNKEVHLSSQVFFTIETSILDSWDFFGNTLESNGDFVEMFGKEVRMKLRELRSMDSKKEYMEIILMEFRKVLEVNYLTAKPNKSILDEWKLSAAEMIKDPVRFCGFISRIDQIRLHMPKNTLLTALGDQIYQISLYKNSKDWWKHSQAILDLFDVNKTNGLYSKLHYQNLLSNIMINAKYTKWKKRYNEIKALENLEGVSLSELRLLDALAYEDGIYLAPVSILDNRLVYDMQEDLYLSKLDSIRQKINLSAHKKERKTLHKELLDLTTFRSTNYNDIRKQAKEKSIKVLQNDFREYIRWAKEATKRRLAKV